MGGEYIDARSSQDGLIYVITTHRLAEQRPKYPFDIGFQTYFWYPQSQYVDPFAVTIYSFNLSDPLRTISTGISVFIESKDVVIYMSESFIYLASNYTDNHGELSTNIKKIFAWGGFFQPFTEGTVKGVVKDQFSLNQFNDFLRIITTRTLSDKKTVVGVYNLNDELKPYGSNADLAPS